MNKHVKSILLACLFMLPAAVTSSVPAHAELLHKETDIKVQINDQLMQFTETQPIVDSSSKLQVPVRDLADKLGYELDWQPVGSQIHITIAKAQQKLSLTTGERQAALNEQPASLDTPARIVDGRVYVPFRLIADAFGSRTQWDSQNRIAILSTDGQYYAPAWYRPQTLTKNYSKAIENYSKVIDAKASAYTASPSENGGYGSLDYMGNPLQLGTIAVDPAVIPLGSKVYIEGYDHDGLPVGGMYATATDTGGAIKGNKIDIFVPQSRDQVMKFGIQQVKVYILGS
ncbi:3D (Asp-Asp-Asp) domain-containing protein [Paenibacillus sp. UNCCL117]|uniref:stalk domain-containing protein n=1 Tax=unclassified Paenibacillus TaxID=185978 RepID=UPI00088E3171|nr:MULTISPECIES: stalk domain-containing protein [unclassified Paenibacillus]SDE08880.1 3D (Asp-Asp-Asp) domain-containing protein [Paenibacillus sp. cl123]SFW58855.1 3D (Asp-Asp-Asp) domain-containing protein [Paenibacillus sp. UNCCL117]